MREADAKELLVKFGMVAALVGLVAMAVGWLWVPLGFSQPKFPEEQEQRFASAALEYHKVAHGRSLPDDPQERAEFIAKVQPIKAAYDQEVSAIDSANEWQEFERKLLLYGGVFLTVGGAFVAKTMESGK